MEIILVIAILICLFCIVYALEEIYGYELIVVVLLCLIVMLVSGWGIYKLLSQDYEIKTYNPIISNTASNYVFYKPLVIKHVEKYKPWSIMREHIFYVEEPQ